MPKLGAKPFVHTLNTARKFAIAKAALDKLGPAPATGTPWGVLYERASASTDYLGMLGNGPDPDNPPIFKDGCGDCVICDDLRAISLWSYLGNGLNLKPTTKDALKLYSLIAGFNETDLNSDTGTDPTTNADYIEKTGWTDANGKVHKIAGWVPIDPLSSNNIKWAIQVFGCVKFCINFPDTASAQFDANQPWSYTAGQQYTIEGGHDVIVVQYDTSEGQIEYQPVSWARRFGMEDNFANQFLSSVIAPCSPDFIRKNGTAPNLLKLDQMLVDLGSVSKMEDRDITLTIYADGQIEMNAAVAIIETAGGTWRPWISNNGIAAIIKESQRAVIIKELKAAHYNIVE